MSTTEKPPGAPPGEFVSEDARAGLRALPGGAQRACGGRGGIPARRARSRGTSRTRPPRGLRWTEPDLVTERALMEPTDEPRTEARAERAGAPDDAARAGREQTDVELDIGPRVTAVFTAAEKAAQHIVDMAREEADDVRRRAEAEAETLLTQRRYQAEEDAARLVAEARAPGRADPVQRRGGGPPEPRNPRAAARSGSARRRGSWRSGSSGRARAFARSPTGCGRPRRSSRLRSQESRARPRPPRRHLVRLHRPPR